MGQALRRATGKVRSSTFNPTGTTTPAPPKPQDPVRAAEKHGRVAADQLGEVLDPVENSSRVSNDSSVLEQRDPEYDVMLNKMVGRVSEKHGGKLETSEAFIVERYKRPLPKVRSSKADVSGNEKRPPPGMLDVEQIKQIILFHQGKSENHQGPLTADDIAKKFKIDVAQVQKILQFVSFPPEGNNKATGKSYDIV